MTDLTQGSPDPKGEHGDGRPGAPGQPAAAPSEQNLPPQVMQISEVLALIHDAVIAIDLDYRVQIWNAAAERIYGISAAEAHGQRLETLYTYLWEHPDAERVALEALAQRGHWRGENVHLCRDGRRLWVESEVRVSYDSAGAPCGMLAVIRDVSARREAAAALLASEQRSRTILRRLTTYAYALRPRPEGRPQLEWVEGDFALLAGQRPGQISLEELLDLFIPSDRPVVEQHVRALLAGEETLVEVCTAASPPRWIRSHAWPEYGPSGELVRILGAGLDITDQKLYEIQLEEATQHLRRTNQALAQANQLKDDFLASMSHELRTPLSSILSIIEAIQESTYGSISSNIQGALQIADRSGQHLLELINDILDLAKIESGKLVVDAEPVDLRQVCRECLQLVERSAARRQLTVQFSDDAAVASVLADRRRLTQILVNLLSNAVKFTPEGGQIGLDLVGDQAGEQVTLTVWDTGIGIAADQLGRLFQPFVQLDSRLARRYSGTGLGLALVARLVELQGGSVRVESALGQGSRFTITLPWRECAAPAAPSAGA